MAGLYREGVALIPMTRGTVTVGVGDGGCCEIGEAGVRQPDKVARIITKTTRRGRHTSMPYHKGVTSEGRKRW